MIKNKFNPALIYCHVIVFSLLILTGCSDGSKEEHIAGPYFLYFKKESSLLMEPGGGEMHISYKENGQDLVICKYPGHAGGTIYNKFVWRVYKDNLVFTERNPNDSSGTKLIVFSKMNKQTTVIDDQFDQYWKIIDDDNGITCHRFQNGQYGEDPSPKYYSAEYIKGL
jgi:hypothetical protein